MNRPEKRVVSGIQPTGNLHLGNYLGAIRRWVRMQDEMECLIFLADLHAITVYNEPEELRRNVNGMAAALIACGIDPEKTLLFNHARVPAHPELAWILSCTARIAPAFVPGEFFLPGSPSELSLAEDRTAGSRSAAISASRWRSRKQAFGSNRQRQIAFEHDALMFFVDALDLIAWITCVDVGCGHQPADLVLPRRSGTKNP